MRYYVNRIDTYHLDQDKKQKERYTKTDSKNNNYETTVLDKIRIKTKKQEQDNRKKLVGKIYIHRKRDKIKNCSRTTT